MGSDPIRVVRSYTTLKHQPKDASIRKVRIVIAPRNLQATQGKKPLSECILAGIVQALKPSDDHRAYPGHLLRRGIQRTEIHRPAERKIVRMEEAASSIRQDPIAE